MQKGRVQRRAQQHDPLSPAAGRAPGKVTATGGGESAVQRRGTAAEGAGERMASWSADPGLLSAFGLGLQRKGDAASPGDAHAIAQAGVSGGGGALPHAEAIQRSFGHHDVSGIRAHSDGAAQESSRALGAEAYAMGHSVAFASSPSLHTAAHEAAHVVQQRAGVQLLGGVGQVGDVHEQHADQVADAVVAGRSAQGLLDQYSGGGGGATVQRQATPPATGGATTGAATLSPEAEAAIRQLDRMLLPIFFGVHDGSFDITGFVSWMELFAHALTDAKVAAGTSPPPELTAAVEKCLRLSSGDLGDVSLEIRDASVQLTNDSSVSKKDPAKAVFPTQSQVKAFSTVAGALSALSRDAALPGGSDVKGLLGAGAAKAQDAALAMLQSLSVVAARDRWKTGTSTETPDASKVGTGPRSELDEIFKDSGWSSRVSKDENGRVFDWCGMFVVSSYFKGAGMAKELRAGFYHVDNVKDFFGYVQAHNASRVPMSIWAEGQWWNLKEYHEARGSTRKWTKRADLQAALVAGTADIRPGDTCLIDHSGGDKPGHIVMVESFDAKTRMLTTIEGNTFGVHADSTGKAERLDDDHLKDSVNGKGTAAGIHQRDLAQLVGGPGPYVVTSAKAALRDEDNLAKVKKEGGKEVLIPVDTKVEVTEIVEHGGIKYAKVKDWGTTKLSNLGTHGNAPKGGYDIKKGATVWGVGRPSVVDFEDDHGYAVNKVPAELRTTSPEEMKELAKKKDKTAAAIKKLDLK